MRVRSLVLPGLTALVVAALALALSHGSSKSVAQKSVSVGGNAASVAIKNFLFAPNNLTVKAGTTVTVTNADSTEHTATSNAPAFDTGTLNQAQSAKFTLRTPGSYSFHCAFHAFMTGTIKVVS